MKGTGPVVINASAVVVHLGRSCLAIGPLSLHIQINTTVEAARVN